MEITLKLYASLSQYLPEAAENHAVKINISASATAFSVLDRFNVPKESAHLVLLNGIYLSADERARSGFKDGDTLAVWPPVAGG